MPGWKLSVRPDEALKEASKAEAGKKYTIRVDEETTAELVDDDARKFWSLPATKGLRFYELEANDSQGDAGKVTLNLAEVVNELIAATTTAPAYGTSDVDTKRLTVYASICSAAKKTRAKAGPSAKPWQADVRAAVSKYCSRDMQTSAFHLKTGASGGKATWPLGYEAAVADVVLKHPGSDTRAIRAAVTE